MASPISQEKFNAAAEELRAQVSHVRVVDALVPYRSQIATFRKEGKSYLDIWRMLKAAGLESSYPNATRAMKEVLEGPVRPLEEARARGRARRAAARGLPTVPAVLRSGVTDAAELMGDPYVRAATQQAADALVAVFGNKGKAGDSKG